MPPGPPQPPPGPPEWNAPGWRGSAPWPDAGGHTPSEGYPLSGGNHPEGTAQYPPSGEGEYIDPYAPDSYPPDPYGAAGYPPGQAGAALPVTGPRHARATGSGRPAPGYGGSRPPGNLPTILAAAVAAAVVIAAVVVVVLVGTRSKDEGSGRTTARSAPSTSGRLSTSAQSTQTGSSGRSPSTEPSNPSSSAGAGDRQCRPDQDAMEAAIALTVTLAFIPADSTPTGYFSDVIKACTAPDLVAKMKVLYGKVFGIPDGGDRTGGADTGPTAEYVFTDTDGARLTLTMSKAADGHYQATKFSIQN
jgi:hypothetical protein